MKKDFQQEDYITKERLHSDYSRSFYIGCKDDTFAEASLNDGVLSVTIDDVTPQKTKRQIEIKQH